MRLGPSCTDVLWRVLYPVFERSSVDVLSSVPPAGHRPPSNIRRSSCRVHSVRYAYDHRRRKWWGSRDYVRRSRWTSPTDSTRLTHHDDVMLFTVSDTPWRHTTQWQYSSNRTENTTITTSTVNNCVTRGHQRTPTAIMADIKYVFWP